MRSVYLDNNATTPVDPRVLEAMLPYFRERFGNAASRNHQLGRIAEDAVDHARAQVANVINATAKEIIWTSGATEGNNVAIQGVAREYAEQGKHIVTCQTEHKAVISPCKFLEDQGFRVTWLKPTKTGLISADQVADAFCEETILVSLMFGNNEIGTIHPIAEIGALCKRKGILFHTDATQAFGKIPIDVEVMGIDLLTMSAHKVYGPKGVGALYVRRKDPRVRLRPIFFGGGHERGLRSGTLNVPGIVGCGLAAEIALEGLTAEGGRVAALRDRLWEGISRNLENVVLHGDLEHRLPNTLNASFLYVEGESLITAMKEIAVSSGSACASSPLEPSYVLASIGVKEDLAHGAIRFSLGRFTTEEDIEYTIDRVVETVRHLRRMNPLYEMLQSGVDSSSTDQSVVPLTDL